MFLLLLLALISPDFAAMCGSAPWSDNERRGILNVHNNLRSKIARGVYSAGGIQKGPASDMIEMVYDCGLEASAQQWANSCPSGHSGAAENLFWAWSSGGANIAGKGIQAANEWEKELQQRGWSSNRMESGIGHATQMAWARSWKIGCGAQRCQGGQVAVVCQYSPAGNIIGHNAFSHGSTCSACPGGTICNRSTGLCSTGQSQGNVDVGDHGSGQWQTGHHHVTGNEGHSDMVQRFLQQMRSRMDSLGKMGHHQWQMTTSW